jgi:hypothetical protein
MTNRFYFLLIMLCTLFGIINAQNKIVPFNNPTIFYEGRIKFSYDAAELFWPGTSANIHFKGTGMSAILKDTDTANYYNIVVDGKNISKIHTDTVKRVYLLVSGLQRGNHRVQLFKRTECDKGKTFFYGFKPQNNTKPLPAPAVKKRKIEFYGNSITCGYGIEDNSGNDSEYGYFENNYLSYAAITARHFDARYSCISKSGIGIMVSWFPVIMPEMYDRLDPDDSTSKWDFNKYIPDIVVINLFQNDSWLIKMPEYEQFKFRFGTKVPSEDYIITSYKNFVVSIRKKYPGATIICALGNMDATGEGSPWTGYIKQASDQLQDPGIYTHFFKYKNSGGHPKVDEQNVMANSLIDFIANNIKW